MAAVKQPTLQAVEEEAIIRTRILTSATATGRAQQPLKVLTRKFLSLMESSEKATSPGALDKPLKELLRELAMMDLQARKLKAVWEANMREQSCYRQKQQQVEEAVIQTRLDISNRKVELQEARVLWEHNQEYEALRGKVMEVSTRPSMKMEMKRLRASMRRVRVEEERINQTLELRRKQFALLLHSIEELQRLDDDAAPTGSLECSSEDEEDEPTVLQVKSEPAAAGVGAMDVDGGLVGAAVADAAESDVGVATAGVEGRAGHDGPKLKAENEDGEVTDAGLIGAAAKGAGDDAAPQPQRMEVDS